MPTFWHNMFRGMKILSLITAEEARALLNYDPNTGEFTWKVSHGSNGKIREGKKTGVKHNKGYVKICINKRQYQAHRIAWLITHGKWPTGVIDHIDRDRSNNRLSNLRDISSVENSHNSIKATSLSKSGLRGVYMKKGSERWCASIRANGEIHALGWFDSKELAYAAYLDAKAKYHPSYSSVV